MVDITQISTSGTLNTSSGVKVTSPSSGTTDTAAADSVDKFKQQFMSILLTQMQNQNPLDPMDTKEFTGQLAQFSSLEQQVTMNSKLDSLLGAIQTSSVATSFGYIGQTVELETPMTTFQGGSADWTYAFNKDAAEMVVKVKNESGQTVYEQTMSNVDSGTYSLSLTQEDLSGTVPEGSVLTLSIEAKDVNGDKIDMETTTTVKVDGIESGEDGISIRSGNLVFEAGDIRKVISA